MMANYAVRHFHPRVRYPYPSPPVPHTNHPNCIFLDRWRRKLVNSEELEVSLRTEFESYLKDVLAEMRQEADQFQSKIEAEFEKHKSQFDEAFRSFAERFDSTREFDAAFTSSVAEHLRLARDEGARITATAMAEAEKLEESNRESAPEPARPSYDLIRDAVNDISSKDTQSAILKSLVQNAGEFAPRGAFFIIKNDHFVGWKVFGDQVETAESAIREIHFPTSSDSILGAAVRSLSTEHGSSADHSSNDEMLSPLDFGRPNQMFAIPLMARGRAVAVLYADQADGNGEVDRGALETIVRVAGLTVELLAASQTAPAETRAADQGELEEAVHDTHTESYEAEQERETQAEHVDSYQFDESVDDSSAYAEPVREEVASEEASFQEQGDVSPVGEDGPAGFAFTDKISFDQGYPQETPQEEPVSMDAGSPFDAPEAVQETAADEQEIDFEEAHPFESEIEEQAEPETMPDAAYALDSNNVEAGGSSPFDQAVESYEPATAVSGSGYSQVAEKVVEAPPAAVTTAPTRLRDRPVDLPIEVPEDERRIHNDARRFARLLVSEIKLYNEKKVVEGREAQDLYDRLREAIDRSREMYDKRVQPPVAAKFDYFHYEIVNSLADGEPERLGSGYPGSSV